MLDIASIIYRMGTESFMDPYWRNEILDALAEAVVYCVRGPGRSEARGLSFCFGLDFTDEELNAYARNCTMPHYLAFLDAISSWTAPDWVYETAARLPEYHTLEGYRVSAEKRMTADGMPGLAFDTDDYRYLAVNYRLYKVDESKNQVVRLGRTTCRSFHTDDGKIIWSAVEPWWWPSIDGVLCDIEMVSATETQALYNIPIQIEIDKWFLRYGREYKMNLEPTALTLKERYGSRYTVYGVWDGYDDNSKQLNRNVQSLSQLVGREYRLLYPINQKNSADHTAYSASEFMTLYRALHIETALLPAGTYYLEYEVQDMLMNHIVLDRIEMKWDGKKVSFPQDFVWAGVTELTETK